jgi:CRP-like cAMP-binding protein
MSRQASPSTSENRLLACLSAADRDLLAPRLKSVKLKLRQRLEMPRRRIRAVYFIDHGLASVVAIGGDRRQTEVGIIGREGMTGLALVMGSDSSAHDTFVQGEGAAHCITAGDLQEAIASSRSLHATLLRYAYVCSVSLAYTALANAQASIEECLARWLLMAHDRSHNDEIHLTHEFLSLMLGTRRAGVTTALNAFDTRGWISHSRGCITIIDRDALQQFAAGLYGVPEAEYQRLLGTLQPGLVLAR